MRDFWKCLSICCVLHLKGSFYLPVFHLIWIFLFTYIRLLYLPVQVKFFLFNSTVTCLLSSTVHYLPVQLLCWQVQLLHLHVHLLVLFLTSSDTLLICTVTLFTCTVLSKKLLLRKFPFYLSTFFFNTYFVGIFCKLYLRKWFFGIDRLY